MPRQRQHRVEEPALVPWEDTQPQVDVLDWRKRAATFGLGPGELNDEFDDEPDLFRAERLLANEEPEADAPQTVPEQEDAEFAPAVLFRDAPDEIRIADAGPGIPAEHRALVFERFEGGGGTRNRAGNRAN